MQSAGSGRRDDAKQKQSRDCASHLHWRGLLYWWTILLHSPPECANVAIIKRCFAHSCLAHYFLNHDRRAAGGSTLRLNKWTASSTTSTSSSIPPPARPAGFTNTTRCWKTIRRRPSITQTKALHAAEKEFSALPADPDRDLILNYIRATLLELEQVRGWEKNPDNYSSGVTNSIFVIMSRTFAPPADRLQSVIARERQIPAVFEAARANLKNPPRIYTEIAIEQLPGIVSFFQNDVPTAFKQVTDAKLLAEFQKSNGMAIDDLKRYQAFLQERPPSPLARRLSPGRRSLSQETAVRRNGRPAAG